MILGRVRTFASSPAVASRTHELESLKFALDTAAIVVTTDARGVIDSINDKFCAISGYSREELIGNVPLPDRSGKPQRYISIRFDLSSFGFAPPPKRYDDREF